MTEHCDLISSSTSLELIMIVVNMFFCVILECDLCMFVIWIVSNPPKTWWIWHLLYIDFVSLL